MPIMGISTSDAKTLQGLNPAQVAGQGTIAGNITDTTSSIAQDAVLTKTTPLGISGKKLAILLCRNAGNVAYGSVMAHGINQAGKAQGSSYMNAGSYNMAYDGGATTYAGGGLGNGASASACQYVRLQDVYISGTDLVTKWLNTGVAGAKTLTLICDYVVL